ncbi:hypothetical protein GDO81_017779 [Engystomops pustulosus]|uniref:Uncharacterized protein n=1 Tax=Engystomops pustulosus TaxID=76066 RepID=A0AAV7AC68_ENGPU|nr:hypothetical protein GDO81_017779 [Engystomops pustulosus]
MSLCEQHFNATGSYSNESTPPPIHPSFAVCHRSQVLLPMVHMTHGSYKQKSLPTCFCWFPFAQLPLLEQKTWTEAAQRFFSILKNISSPKRR